MVAQNINHPHLSTVFTKNIQAWLSGGRGTQPARWAIHYSVLIINICIANFYEKLEMFWFVFARVSTVCLCLFGFMLVTLTLFQLSNLYRVVWCIAWFGHDFYLLQFKKPEHEFIESNNTERFSETAKTIFLLINFWNSGKPKQCLVNTPCWKRQSFHYFMPYTRP